MRNYQGIANLLIKNARWYRVRRKVRQALEQAYRDGLSDAAAEVTASSAEVSERILVLGKEARPPVLPAPAPLSH